MVPSLPPFESAVISVYVANVLSDYEPLRGTQPWRVLDRHPDGRHVALQVTGNFGRGDEQRAGVWDETTRRLSWAPSDATALGWFPDGREIAAVTETFMPRPAERRGFVIKTSTPLQSEFQWSLERRAWPGGDITASCPIRSWTGWFDRVVVSPAADRIAVCWADQTEAGMVLVEVGEQGLAQIDGAAWDTRETNWIEGPMFSRTGQLLALALNPEGATNWWGGEDNIDPSPGGRSPVGHVIVLDPDLKEAFRERIDVDVPAGWVSDSDETLGMSLVRFDGPEELVVRVPLEGERRIRVASGPNNVP
jgi:hypothetical protein